MNEFLDYLKNKGVSENTLIAYKRDIAAFSDFMQDNRSKSVGECSESDAVAYVMDLDKASKSKSTINRKVSALRTYYDYLMGVGSVSSNPFSKIKTARNEKRQIEYLSVEEVERLVDLPDDSAKGKRDRALLEFMYGTGARVTEVVRLKCSDINLKMGFATLKDAGEAGRIVPLGRYARAALDDYINGSYAEMLGHDPRENDYLFVNLRGEVLTRQGIWKMLKDYGEKIGVADRMTPQILRDTYAVHILMNGGDLKTLQELMGFDDMSVGIAYLAVTEIHVREVFARCHPRA